MKVYVDLIRSREDADRCMEILQQRPGAPEPWEMLDAKGRTYVARSERTKGVVAFARVRLGTPTVIDVIEGERADDHATPVAVAGMLALARFIEGVVERGGGGRTVAMVASENAEHTAALCKVGYRERVRVFYKDVAALERSEA